MLTRSMAETLLRILRRVVQATGVSEVRIRGALRTRETTDARFIFAWLAREETEVTYTALGHFLGRDHSTIMHAVHQVKRNPHLLRDARQLLTRSNVKLSSCPGLLPHMVRSAPAASVMLVGP